MNRFTSRFAQSFLRILLTASIIIAPIDASGGYSQTTHRYADKSISKDQKSVEVKQYFNYLSGGGLVSERFDELAHECGFAIRENSVLDANNTQSKVLFVENTSRDRKVTELVRYGEYSKHDGCMKEAIEEARRSVRAEHTNTLLIFAGVVAGVSILTCAGLALHSKLKASRSQELTPY